MLTYIFFMSIFSICLLCLIITIRFKLMKSVRRDNMRYKLFSVRDGLISLVATKDLSENDFLFKEFYSMINTSIVLIDDFSLKKIVKASREHKITLQQEKVVQELIDELERKNATVKTVINDFFYTMIEILLAKSITLRIGLRLAKAVNFIEFILNKLPSPKRLRRRSIEPYRVYEFYSDSQQLGCILDKMPSAKRLRRRSLEPYKAYEFYQGSQHRLGLT